MAADLSRIKSTDLDWTSLPPELLYLITRKLSHLLDFIRFRAVCKPWLTSVPISDPPLEEFPWILEESTRFSVSSHLRFFSPSSGKVFTIPLPSQLQGKRWGGPAHDGYLLFDEYPDKGLSLFNPLTNHKVHLPSLDDPRLYYDRTRTLQRIGNYAIVHSKLGSSPKAFFRLGDKEWLKTDYPQYRNSISISCHNGVYFSIDWQTDEISIVDVSTNDLCFSALLHTDENSMSEFLIESFGEILKVVMLNSSECHIHFRVYKLTMHYDNGNLHHCWVQTDNIGDCALFLYGKTGISFKANQFCRPVCNCIYFRKILENGGSAICRYSIEDGANIQQIPCTFNNWHFFMPSLHHLTTSDSG